MAACQSVPLRNIFRCLYLLSNHRFDLGGSSNELYDPCVNFSRGAAKGNPALGLGEAGQQAELGVRKSGNPTFPLLGSPSGNRIHAGASNSYFVAHKTPHTLQAPGLQQCKKPDRDRGGVYPRSEVTGQKVETSLGYLRRPPTPERLDLASLLLADAPFPDRLQGDCAAMDLLQVAANLSKRHARSELIFDPASMSVQT